jgi:hypothetical protein
MLGDIERSSHLSERDHIKRDLAALDTCETGQGTFLAGRAKLLKDVRTGWGRHVQSNVTAWLVCSLRKSSSTKTGPRR